MEQPLAQCRPYLEADLHVGVVFEESILQESSHVDQSTKSSFRAFSRDGGHIALRCRADTWLAEIGAQADAAACWAQERRCVPGRLDDVVDAHSWPFHDEIGEGHPPSGLLLGESLTATGETGGSVASNHDEALVELAYVVIGDF